MVMKKLGKAIGIEVLDHLINGNQFKQRLISRNE